MNSKLKSEMKNASWSDNYLFKKRQINWKQRTKLSLKKNSSNGKHKKTESRSSRSKLKKKENGQSDDLKLLYDLGEIMLVLWAKIQIQLKDDLPNEKEPKAPNIKKRKIKRPKISWIKEMRKFKIKSKMHKKMNNLKDLHMSLKDYQAIELIQ